MDNTIHKDIALEVLKEARREISNEFPCGGRDFIYWVEDYLGNKLEFPDWPEYDDDEGFIYTSDNQP